MSTQNKEKFLKLFYQIILNEVDILEKKANMIQVLSMLIKDNFPDIIEGQANLDVAHQLKDYIDAGNGLKMQLEDFEKIDISSLNIISNPQMRGTVHVPLYPYSKTNLFGFLEFTWDKDEDFVMSDILYFLKLLFSNEIKTIFTNQKNNQNLKERLNDILKANSDVTIAFLEVDNRYKLLNELSEDEANILNMKISDDIMQEFVGYVVFEVFPFIYGLCENSEEEETKDRLKNFLADRDKHNYFISPSRGNIAVTFSAGLSSKKERDIDVYELIEEAESGLDVALDHGGNWVNSFGEI